MKFTKYMFELMNDSTGICIGEIKRKKVDGVNVILGIIDSSFDRFPKRHIMELKDIDIIETKTPWQFDRSCDKSNNNNNNNTITASKWIDFVDLDGDVHHGHLTKILNPEIDSYNYILEVDLLSELSSKISQNLSD